MSVSRSLSLFAFSVLCLSAVAVGPDGNEWQDPSRLSLNKEPITAVKPVVDLDLSGVEAWRFKWSRRPSERPADFYRTDYDVSGWDKVTVPCSWQTIGIRPSGERYGVPLYVNQPYLFTPALPKNTDCPPRVVGNDLPADWTFSKWDNPVGSYRRDFDVPADWLADEIYIRFEAVESFFYLWINGEYVGFSKDSRDPAMFNITKHVRAGKNVVAAEVYRFCDGSYLECQDIYRLSGILRPVTVSHVRKEALRDLAFETHPATRGVYDGDWILSVRPDLPVEVPGLKLEKQGAGKWLVTRPKLWSAEEPNLYELRCRGRTFNLGFREVEITEPADPRDRTFLVNGKPVKLKGVNRAEVDPTYGHHCPTATLLKDLELIKKGNFNHIRNSHNPQPDEFYDLCDRYGIYVMDEANIESHGLGYGKESLSWRKEWEPAHLDRIRAMVNRNRNHPSVVIWSMGNEAGPGDVFKTCYDWIKANDPTRPVNYERNCFFADMGSRQYPGVEWIKGVAAGHASVKYPFHINEFLHNLNNGAGGVKSFQDAIESSDRILGGALWDFADQSLWAKGKRKSEEGKSVEVRYLAWGGDFGEKPNEGQGILDGIVHADRGVEPSYYESRHVYQPFETKLSADGRSLVIESKYFFRDSSAYDFCVDGRVVPLKPLAPREVRTLPLSSLNLQPSTSTFIVSFVQRAAEGFYEKGWVIASDQVRLPVAPETAVGLPYVPPKVRATKTETESELRFAAGDYQYAFDKKTGSLVSILKKGEELLEKPVFLDVFRAPVGGDINVGTQTASAVHQWAERGLRVMVPRLREMAPVVEEGAALRFATLVDWRGARKEAVENPGRNNTKIVDCGALGPDEPGYHVATEWKVYGDGTLQVEASFRQFGFPTEVARIGYRFVLKGTGFRVDYKAAGPWDNYSDRRSSAFVGTYSMNSDDCLENYGRSSDSGNRMEASAVRLDRTGLTFAALGRPLAAFQVCPYSPAEILENVHPALMPPPRKTELGLYACQAGIGSHNCGPLPEADLRVASHKTHTFAFLMTPETTLERRTVKRPSEASDDAAGVAPPKPDEMMIYPGDERVVLGGKAVMKCAQMRFCSETFFRRYAGDGPTALPLGWMLLKPRTAKGKCPLVVFLNARGNHELLSERVTGASQGPVRNATVDFVINHYAGVLTRGRLADPANPDYLPIRELIERGYAVVTACHADGCPELAAVDGDVRRQRGPKTLFSHWKDRPETKEIRPQDVWAWMLSRGLDYAAQDDDVDPSRATAVGFDRWARAAELAAERDRRFTASLTFSGDEGSALLKAP